MDINWTEVAAVLKDATTFISSPAVTALATFGGPTTEGIVSMVQGLATTSASVVATVQQAGTAIESGDLETIVAADTAIQASNAQLAAQVAAS